MRKAFTLIELLVVIAMIAILAALLLPVFTKAQKRDHSRDPKTLERIRCQESWKAIH